MSGLFPQREYRMASKMQVLRITAEEWRSQKANGLAVLIDQHPYVVVYNAYTGEPSYHPVVILEPQFAGQSGWVGFREARRDATTQGQMDQADGT